MFRDVAESAGIHFRYDNDLTPQLRFIETTGGGCALLDYNNDGWLDILAVQGGPAPGSPARSRPPHALYRNDRGYFTLVTKEAGLEVDTGYAQGASAADYDNDGWCDVLITTYGGPRLFRNHHAHFEEVTKEAGLVMPGEAHWSVSAAWADYDNDGNLDVFVTNYASWFPDAERPCLDSANRPMVCNPTQYAYDTCYLYHNRGNGTFEDVSEKIGLTKYPGRGMVAVWIDGNQDGIPGIFVSNDFAPNRLLSFDRFGRLHDLARILGVALGSSGQSLSGMGVACGDFSGDGREDIIVTNFSRQPRSYFVSSPQGQYDFGPMTGGIGPPEQPYLGFGVESLDFDLDGRLDLVIGNGHLAPSVDEYGQQVTYKERQQLLRNLGTGEFKDDTDNAGDLTIPRVTRGLAVGDIDNDGRADILVSGPGCPMQLYHNEAPGPLHWIGLRLEGDCCNRDAIGAVVRVRTGKQKQVRTVRCGSSYASRSDIRLVFGLGKNGRASQVDVIWPCGTKQDIGQLITGKYYYVHEGSKTIADPRLGTQSPSGEQK